MAVLARPGAHVTLLQLADYMLGLARPSRALARTSGRSSLNGMPQVEHMPVDRAHAHVTTGMVRKQIAHLPALYECLYNILNNQG